MQKMEKGRRRKAAMKTQSACWHRWHLGHCISSCSSSAFIRSENVQGNLPVTLLQTSSDPETAGQRQVSARFALQPQKRQDKTPAPPTGAAAAQFTGSMPSLCCCECFKLFLQVTNDNTTNRKICNAHRKPCNKCRFGSLNETLQGERLCGIVQHYFKRFDRTPILC